MKVLLRNIEYHDEPHIGPPGWYYLDEVVYIGPFKTREQAKFFTHGMRYGSNSVGKEFGR